MFQLIKKIHSTHNALFPLPKTFVRIVSHATIAYAVRATFIIIYHLSHLFSSEVCSPFSRKQLTQCTMDASFDVNKVTTDIKAANNALIVINVVATNLIICWPRIASKIVEKMEIRGRGQGEMVCPMCSSIFSLNKVCSFYHFRSNAIQRHPFTAEVVFRLSSAKGSVYRVD